MTGPSAKVRQIAAARVAKILKTPRTRIHIQHVHYVPRFSNVYRRH